MSLVIDKLQEHYDYALKCGIDRENILGIFLVGSQNYGTDLPTSDVDTKLITVPSLKDIYANKKGESKTYYPVEGSKEEMVAKDIRCVISEFKKQNLNMLEILFTEYCIVNPAYKEIWNKLLQERDQIARYDQLAAARTTKGIALNTYDRLFREDGTVSTKQTANLVRLEYYLKSYIDQKLYIQCMRPEGDAFNYIMQIRKHEIGDNSLMRIADATAASIRTIVDAYCQRTDIPSGNSAVDDLFDEVCKEAIDASFFMEYARNGEL